MTRYTIRSFPRAVFQGLFFERLGDDARQRTRSLVPKRTIRHEEFLWIREVVARHLCMSAVAVT